MFSKLSFFTMFMVFASMFFISSAVPMAEVQVERRGCGRWACMDALTGAASELPIETSTSVSAIIVEASSVGAAAASTQAAEPTASAAAILSSTPSSGALFNVNAPALSYSVALAATATAFTFLL